MLTQDDVYNPGTYGSGVVPWAAAGKLALNVLSNGTAELLIGSAALPAGQYWFQPQATAPNGTIVKNRFMLRVRA